ncbi:TolC family protein [Prosthecobacter sp.]|uniref:TolC family protein n=1 Tax=Prosthecobacter sp. TaxID=1965333 RepID=UPI001DA853EB|nr:TolC family protein [Prosthecobacter sp.]MCB1279410.1 TolC family protein [Prosthecobacter sp.]
MSVALANNPEMAAAEARVARMEAKVPQAKALPDPMAMVSLGNMAQTAAGRVTAMSGLQQKLPLPGKLGAKARMAEEEVTAARAMRDAKALGIASMVRSTYWDLYLAEQTARVLTSSRNLIGSVQTAVEARLITNQANQADLLQVTTEAAKLDEQIILAKRDATVAKARLNTLMHRPQTAALPAARWQSSIGRLPAEPPLDDHPAMAQAAAKLRQFNAQLKLARLERFPDLTVGLQHGAVSNSGLSPVHNGQDQLYATLGVNIPLWQAPRKAAEEEARAGQRESEAGISATRDELSYQLSETRTRVETQKRLIELFDDRILADAKQAFEVSLAGYSSGKLPFVDLIERWRRWLGYEVQQSMNQAMLGKAVAAWWQAAGIPVTSNAN